MKKIMLLALCFTSFICHAAQPPKFCSQRFSAKTRGFSLAVQRPGQELDRNELATIAAIRAEGARHAENKRKDRQALVKICIYIVPLACLFLCANAPTLYADSSLQSGMSMAHRFDTPFFHQANIPHTCSFSGQTSTLMPSAPQTCSPKNKKNNKK